jgi:EamA domain-containing membrane protein RarD
VVLSSLYPVIPVVLGLVVLGEKLTRIRTMGLIAALLAVALLVFD